MLSFQRSNSRCVFMVFLINPVLYEKVTRGYLEDINKHQVTWCLGASVTYRKRLPIKILG